MTVGRLLRFAMCVWFPFLSGPCLYEKSSLKVSSPENLKGTYDCAVSSFGLPEHGGTLTGVVVYPKVNQEACHSFPHDFSFKTKAHVGSLPVFLLVDDKDCYFTTKARNAQNAGAAGILIAYNEFFSSMYFLPEEVENLTIPSAMISKSLSDSMKKALDNGDEFIRVNLEWTESFTHLDDVNNNVDEIIRLMIKYSPIWGFMMLNLKGWLVFVCIGSEPMAV